MAQSTNHVDQLLQATQALPSTGLDEYPRRPQGLLRSNRAQIVRYLRLSWRADAIAETCHVHISTVYRIESNIMRYGGPTVLRYRSLGRPSKLTQADKKALLEWLLIDGWAYLDEMVSWLWNERGVIVDKSTISRLLKRNKWSKKALHRISI